MPLLVPGLWAFLVAAAPQVDVSGRVINAQTGGALVDVWIVLTPLDVAGDLIEGGAETTRTASDGRFVFRGVPPGSYSLAVSTVGYIYVRRRIEVTGGDWPELLLPLAEGAGTYEEHVTVTADVENASGDLGSRTLGPAGLLDLRGVVTDDPMRAVHALPGVATGDDFQAGFSVRGSPFRHAGVTIDGVPAMRLLHAVNAEANAGSISMINTDVLARATLLVGARPAPDGDWIGATLAFELRDGSRDRFAQRVALSGTSASMVAEGPLGDGRRGSWLLSVRKSYLDWLVRTVEPGFDSTVGFWDGHAKAVFDISPRHTVQVFVVGGDARYREDEVSSPNALLDARSGATVAALAWRQTGDRWMQRHRVFFLGSEFRNTGSETQELARGYTQELGWRGEVERAVGGGWLVAAGGAWSTLRGAQVLRTFERLSAGGVRPVDTHEAEPAVRTGALWTEISRSTSWGRLSMGGRGTVRSGTTDRAVLPWVVAERDVGRLTLRAAAGGSAQFADPLATIADGEAVRLERAASFDLGVSQDAGAGIRWSVGAFVRRERNVLRSVAEDRLDQTTGERILAAPFPYAAARLRGRTAGVDLIVRRDVGSGPTGWLSYTWARSRMHDPTTGEWFDADFDQRHTLNLVVSQRLSYRSAMNLKLRMGSNMPLVGYFAPDGEGLRLASDRNRVRLPVYARLDLRATRAFIFARHRLTLFVEVMNVLGRRNVGPADPSVRASLQVTGYAERLIPRVPSAGFVVEF